MLVWLIQQMQGTMADVHPSSRRGRFRSDPLVSSGSC
jgi:hypothetical protein